ncbi:hypothetical protein HZC21_02185 [Candidatus Peregrinibacteria bacterium]|nr:hypothetical protein [Candidatus Peregrinibacteria bacterium]
MNKLTFASLAVVTACSGAPVKSSSLPEIETTQRQALAALQATQEGFQNNGDFVYCAMDYRERAEIKKLIDQGLIPAGATAAFLLEDETKHSAILIAGEEACAAQRYNIARRIQECLLGYNEVTLQRKRRGSNVFSIPIYCDGTMGKGNPTHTCNAFITIDGVGKNEAKDDVCVRVSTESELIPTPQTPRP